MSLAISRHFSEVLDAPLRNERWSWGAFSSRFGALVLRVWDDERDGDSIQIFKERGSDNRPGQAERLKHRDDMIAGVISLGVVCVAKDPKSEKRSIRSYDSERLSRLGMPWRRDDGSWFAPVTDVLSLQDLEDSAIGSTTLHADIVSIEKRSLPPTTRRALIDARIGQGRFREELLALWEGGCAVTGCVVAEVLRASHAKPWRQSSDKERLDPHNGLPLMATLDALFDSGLITFDRDGSIRISDRLTQAQRDQLELPKCLRKVPGKRLARYLDHHRRGIFR